MRLSWGVDTAGEIAGIRERLLAQAKPGRAEFEKGYHKSDLDFLGSAVPAQRKEAKALLRRHGLSRELVDALWATRVHDLRATALFTLQYGQAELSGDDLPWVESLMRECKGWALLDTIAVHVMGPILKQEARLDLLDEWSQDEDFWVRRASLLALLLPLREGDLTDWDRFERYAVPMLGEKEFFIGKAIGWVLRETSKKSPEVVHGFLAEHESEMSGLTRREARKHLDRL